MLQNSSDFNGNNDLIKKINLEKVLRTLISNQPISRAQIAYITGLNKVTVSSCIDFFVEKKIVQEIGTTETRRGRPPILLELNRQLGFCIGIEVEYKELKILVADASGNELEHRTMPLSNGNPEYFVDLLSQLISELKLKYESYPLGLIGVGIALAGYYNQQTGTVEYIASLQSWNNFPILSKVQRIDPAIHFYINSTVNAGALGELRQHKTDPPEVFIYVGGLWGLGVGICINGKVFSGKTGFAGRIGHSTIKIDGKTCRCGNKGCWELYASADALYHSLYPGNSIQHKNFNEIVLRFKNGDSEVLKAVEQIGYYLGIGLANVINAYNPDAICIGGYLGLLGKPLIDVIFITLKEVLPEHFLKNLKIYCSDSGEYGAAAGSISLVLQAFPKILLD